MLFIAPFRKRYAHKKEEAIMKAKAKEDAVFFIDQKPWQKTTGRIRHSWQNYLPLDRNSTSYSPRNTMLILNQNRGAEFVASFRDGKIFTA